MDAVLVEVPAIRPWLQPGYEQPPDGKEYRISQERMNVIHKESLCINCGCCVSECNAMEADPEFLGPQALAKGMRFVGDPRDAATVERLEDYNCEHGIWDCTRCYFCNERCPKGVDPRDAIAKLGAESIKHGIDRDMGAKHAKWFVTLGEDDRLAARDGARAEDAGHHLGDQADGLRARAREARQGAAAGAAARREGRAAGARPARHRQGAGPRRARSGSCRASARCRGSSTGTTSDGAARDPYGEGSFPRPFLPGENGAPPAGGDQGMGSRTQADVTPGAEPTRKPGGGVDEGRVLQGLPRVALREGARHLDAGARADARPRARGAGVGHVLRRRRHPRGRAGLLPPPERAHPRVRGGDRRRHADDDLQRLHAQPAAGELAAQGRRGAARARQREPRGGRRARVLAATST